MYAKKSHLVRNNFIGEIAHLSETLELSNMIDAFLILSHNSLFAN